MKLCWVISISLPIKNSVLKILSFFKHRQIILLWEKEWEYSGLKSFNFSRIILHQLVFKKITNFLLDSIVVFCKCWTHSTVCVACIISYYSFLKSGIKFCKEFQLIVGSFITTQVIVKHGSGDQWCCIFWPAFACWAHQMLANIYNSIWINEKLI